MDNLSLADVAAVTGGDKGFLEGNGIIILILFFLMFGYGGMWGNRNNEGYATPTQVYDATNQQSITNNLNGIKEAVNAGTYENARLIDSVNYNGMQNTNSVINAMNTNMYNVGSQITALSHQLSDCCCNLRSQMLQDRNADLQNQLNLAQIASANAVQTQNILGSIGRFVTNPPCYGYNYSNYYNGTTIA